MSKLPDYFEEAIDEGEAIDFRKSDIELERYFISKIDFLRDIWGDEWVANRAQGFIKEMSYDEPLVMFKEDIDSTISRWLPTIMVATYRKILDDFKQELEKGK